MNSKKYRRIKKIKTIKMREGWTQNWQDSLERTLNEVNYSRCADMASFGGIRFGVRET